jgi:hypothetical protein
MKSRPSALRDFTVDRRAWLLTGVAAVIGVGGAALAVILLRAIALATNIFYYHWLSLAMVGPAGSPDLSITACLTVLLHQISWYYFFIFLFRKNVIVFAYSDETCGSVAEEMATSGRLSMPVIERETGRLCGHISAAELLAGRRRAVNRETERSIAFLPVSQAE